MGWSFRKSIKMGPLRVNVSRSGIGASVGVRGARVAVGPRGTYVSFAGGGFSYRKKLNNSPRPVAPAVEPTTESFQTGNIQSASVGELAASTPEWMISDAQLRLKRWNLFKLYCWVLGTILFFVWVAGSMTTTLVFLLLVLAGGVGVYQWDQERRTARVIYDVDDPEIIERLAMVNGAAQWLGNCAALWHIFHSVQTSDWKKNAGAGTLIRRTVTRCTAGPLPCFELNVEAWSVPVGPQQLLFLPDRLLVWDGTQLAALRYETVTPQASATRFIEDGGPLPRDGYQVDSTWRFVRRDGGPDLRFSNNAQLPVMRYGELELTSQSGLRVVMQTSTVEAAEGAARALLALAGRANQRIQPNGTQAAALHEKSNHVQSKPQVADPAVEVATSAATLLRYLAAADRRVDSTEVAYAEKALGQLLPADHPALIHISTNFRALPTDPNAVEHAVQTITAAGPDYCRWVVDSLTAIASADGKVTPKENERLAEVRQALGV